MLSRHKCPNCKFDLKATPPKPTKIPWYTFSRSYTLDCPSCGVALKKRFANFDMALLLGMTSGGAVSIWGGAGKILLPIIAAMFVIRFVVSRVLSVYVLSNNDSLS